MQNSLFPEMDNPKKEDWIPPDEPFVNPETLKNAKTIEIFLPAWTGKQNPSNGPISKQSMKTSFIREKGKKEKLKIKISENGYEMPIMISRPPEPSASGGPQQKMMLKDILNWIISEGEIDDLKYFVLYQKSLPKDSETTTNLKLLQQKAKAKAWTNFNKTDEK